MTRFAFIIRFNDPDFDHALLVGHALKVLHGFQYRLDSRSIGVCFPFWVEATIGHGIGFVSQDHHLLQSLSELNYFQDMQYKWHQFQIGTIMAIPDTGSEVRYVRNQAVDELFSGGIKRAIKRCERRSNQRGQTYQRNLTNTKPDRIEHFHSIPMSSSVNPAKQYYFHIQREPASDVDCSGYSSYGLAGKTKNLGTVPQNLFF